MKKKENLKKTKKNSKKKLTNHKEKQFRKEHIRMTNNKET